MSRISLLNDHGDAKDNVILQVVSNRNDSNNHQTSTSHYGGVGSDRSSNGTTGQDEPQDDQPSVTKDLDNIEIDYELLRMCAVYTSIYVSIAVIAFSFIFENWTIIDSMYFAVATFTTVGYGDLQPTTQSGQLFTIIFALYGVVILGIFIGVVGHAIGEHQAKTINTFKQGQQRKLVHKLFQSSRSFNTTTRTYANAISETSSITSSRTSSLGSIQRQQSEEVSFLRDHSTLFTIIADIIRSHLPQILLIIALATVLGIREGWSFTSTMYFAVMSASTTGYGDYTPKSQIDKLYCIFFLPLSVAVFGDILGRIASSYIQRRQRRIVQQCMNRSLTLCDIRRMDANHDGTVDMQDFVFCTYIFLIL